MKKIFFILLSILATAAASAQVGNWQPRGTRDKFEGIAAKKIFMFPTGCGAPSSLLQKDSAEKLGAIYADTCNHRLWFWDSKTLQWDSVHVGIAGVGGSTDTTNLSNRINQKLNISDYSLQKQFDREIGGSQLSKGDTIITNAAAQNGLHLKVTRPAAAPWNAMTFTPYGFNVYGNDYHYTKIQDGQVIQKGNWPFTAYLDTTNKIVMSIGYDYDWDHAYLDRADSIDLFFEDGSAWNQVFVARKSRHNPTLAGGIFFAPQAIDYIKVGIADVYTGDKFHVEGNVKVTDTLKAAGKLKFSGIPTAKKSQLLYFDPSTKMVSAADTAITDSTKIRYGGNVGVSIVRFAGDTLVFRNLVASGCLTVANTTDSTTTITLDTACLSGKYLRITDTANMRPRLVAGSNVTITGTYPNLTIASTGGGGSGVDSFWTVDHNANYKQLNNLTKLTSYRALVSGGGGTTYATWNPADKASGLALSGGNLIATGSAPGTNHEMVRATIGKSTGKWYWEVGITSGGSGSVGVAAASASLTGILGGDAAGHGYKDDGEGRTNGSAAFFGASWTTGDVLGFKLDVDAGTLEVLKNNTSINTFTGLSGTIYPAASSGVFSACTYTANFGATAFTYSVPSGYNSGVYTSGGGDTTYQESFAVDTTGKIRMNIANLPVVTKDTALTVDGATNEVKRVFLKNFGNSDFTQTVSERKYLFGYSGTKALIFGKSDLSEKVNFYIGNNSSSGVGYWQAYAKDSATGIEMQYYSNPGNKYNYILVNNSSLGKSNSTKNYLDSTTFRFYHRDKTYGFGADSMYIKGNMPVSASSSDSVLVRDNNGVIKTRAQSDISGGGGGSSWTQTVATDANITAAASKVYVIPSGVLTANRNFDLSSITTDLNEIEIYNYEGTYQYNFTGGTVYLLDGVTTVSAISSPFTKIKRINGKITIIN